MSCPENLSYESQVLSPGSPAPPRAGSTHLGFSEEDRAPSCLPSATGMGLWVIISTFQVGFHAGHASQPSSKPPTTIEPFPDFLPQLPFFVPEVR